MNRGSTWYCATMFALLLLSTVTSAVILTDPYWDGDTYGDGGTVDGISKYSNAQASATGDDCYCYGYAQGEHFVYTTTTQYCYYESYIYVDVEAQLLIGDDGYGYAVAHANIAAPWDSTWRSCHCTAYDAEGEYIFDWYPGGYQVGYGIFGPGSGLRSTHSIVALGSVPEDGDSVAMADATARAWATMEALP